MKRTFDIVFALVALGLLSIFMFIIAAAVWLSDHGKILYRHQRIGRYGTPFYVLKFRTMVENPSFKSELTLKKDPRITPIGRFLRATKLDELPQLFNVLTGEMSIVGPRPESPRFVAHYSPVQREALTMRPGLTGPASVLFRSQEQLLDGMDFEEYYIAVLMPTKMAINLEYVHHHSLWIDFKIIMRTVIALVHPVTPPPLVSPAAVVQAILPQLPDLEPREQLDRLAQLEQLKRINQRDQAEEKVGSVEQPEHTEQYAPISTRLMIERGDL